MPFAIKTIKGPKGASIASIRSIPILNSFIEVSQIRVEIKEESGGAIEQNDVEREKKR